MAEAQNPRSEKLTRINPHNTEADIHTELSFYEKTASMYGLRTLPPNHLAVTPRARLPIALEGRAERAPTGNPRRKPTCGRTIGNVPEHAPTSKPRPGVASKANAGAKVSEGPCGARDWLERQAHWPHGHARRLESQDRAPQGPAASSGCGDRQADATTGPTASRSCAGRRPAQHCPSRARRKRAWSSSRCEARNRARQSSPAG